MRSKVMRFDPRPTSMILAFAALSACATTGNPAPVAEPDLSQRMQRVIALSTRGFDEIRSPEARPGSGGKSYDTTLPLWSTPICSINQNNAGEEWYYSCPFGFIEDDQVASARFETISKDMSAALPDLAFAERTVNVPPNCKRRISTAVDAATGAEVYAFYDPASCRMGKAIVNFVIKAKRADPPAPSPEN